MSNDKQAPELKMINGSAHLDGSHLLQYVERIEKLNEDAEAIAADIKGVLIWEKNYWLVRFVIQLYLKMVIIYFVQIFIVKMECGK